MFKEICRPCIVAIGISLGATPITCMALEDNLIYNAGNSDFVSQDNTECLNSLDGIWLGTPNGIYESNGRKYYIEDGFFLINEWKDGTFYTMLGVPASNEIYAFHEECDNKFWEALEKVSSSEEDVDMGLRFVSTIEAVSYKNRVDDVFNLSDRRLEMSICDMDFDGYFEIYIKSNDNNRSVIEEIEKGNELLTQIYDTYIKGIEGEEERLEAIYDWVTHNIKYDRTLESRKGYKGLTEGKAVCIGYTQVFYWLCKKANIDVEFVEGVSSDSEGNFDMNDKHHVWNRVKLTGASDYSYCDATWDSPDVGEESVSRKYYMRSLEEFDTSHRAFWVYD